MEGPNLISAATPLAALEALVVDTETTGLDATAARLVQIAAVGVRGAEIVQDRSFERLVNPGAPIPKASSRIHGIRDADVADAPTAAEALTAFSEFSRGGVIVGHTISFDVAILSREAMLAGIDWRKPRALDVRWLAKAAAPSMADYGLDGLCSWLGVAIAGRHTAMGDAAATAKVYVALLPMLAERGVRTLAEAEAACRREAEREAAHLGGTPAAPEVERVDAGVARIDSYPYRRRVAEVMSSPPATLPGAATLADAVAHLIDTGVSSVFVPDEAGEFGIVTERDVLRALAAKGDAALATPLSELRQHPLESVEAEDFVYRAIGRMDRIGVRHLGVVDASGELVGAVTTRNLLRHRSGTAMVLGDAIASATSAEDLAAAWAGTPAMACRLVDEGVDPRTVAAVVSAEIRALTRRATELAVLRMNRAGLGPAPCRYAVLVLGSAGRDESLLAADQDNAIIYESGEPGGPEDRWFEILGGHIAEALDTAGVVLCKGGVMAKNAAWRKSVAEWRATVDGWIGRQRKEDLLNVDIFFDSTPVAGDRALSDQIIAHAFDLGRAAPVFRRALADTLADWRPVVGMFGSLRAGPEGRVDMKLGGLFPVFTAARILAIKHGSRARGTPARLRAAAEAGAASPDQVERILDAHKLILGATLAQQIEDIEAGRKPGSKVDVRRLERNDRRALTTALSHAGEAVDLVREGML